MFSAVAIVFRESFEVLIFIISLMTYVKRLKNARLFKFIGLGSVAGIILSSATGFLIYERLQLLQGLARQIFEGSMMIFVSILIAYSFLFMSRIDKNQEVDIEQKYNLQPTGFSMFVIPFIVVYRESLEAIMMLLPLVYNPRAAAGIIFGLTLAIILALCIYRFALKFNISFVFTVMTAVFIYVGAMLFGEGIASLLPQSSGGIASAGKLIYAIPAVYLFIKGELKRYIGRKQK